MVFGGARGHGLPKGGCDAAAGSETVAEAAARLVEQNDPASFGAALAELVENHVLRAELASASLEAGGNLISWEYSAALVGEMLDSLPAENN